MTVKNKILYFLKGGVVAKVFGFISFLYIAKIVSLESFAIYTIYLFVAELALTFLGVGLNSYIMRNSNEAVRLDVFPKAMFTIIFIFCIFSLSFIIFEPILRDYLSETYQKIFDFKFLILFILINKLFINMCMGYFVSTHQANNHMKVNITNSITLLLVLLFNSFVLKLVELDLIFYSFLFSTSISVLVSFLLIKNNSFIKIINIYEVIKLINESYPFMLKSAIGIFGLYLSRIILEQIATKEELAAYSFYLVIVFQLSFFVNILSQSLIPTVRDNFDKMDAYKKKAKVYYKKFIFLILGFMVIVFFLSCLISIGKLQILNTIIREEYLSYIWVFSILLIAFFIGSTRTIFDVWQYHESIDVKLKLIVISIANVLLGIIIYPIMYNLLNIYGVAVGYIMISSVFTYVSYYYFRDLQRRIKLEKNIHNS